MNAKIHFQRNVLPPQFAGVVVWGGAMEKDQFKSCIPNNADMLLFQAHASFKPEAITYRF